jgi:HEAT repeat protein
MVSFDGQGALVAEIRFEKSIDELVFQMSHDELPGRIWAVREAARQHPSHSKTLKAFSDILTGSDFWGLKAEVALCLGEIRGTDAQKAIRHALSSPDYHVRKAAVLALPRFQSDFSEKILIDIINKENHDDVVATAIVALARTNPHDHVEFIQKQIQRSSWYEEIKLACLKAFGIIGHERLVADIQPYTHEKYHEFLRTGALEAWRSCDPEDETLQRILKQNAAGTQPGVQIASIVLLGDLYITEAIPILERITTESGDIDFRVTARGALDKIKRIKK